MWVLQMSPAQHQALDSCMFPSCVLYLLYELLGTFPSHSSGCSCKVGLSSILGPELGLAQTQDLAPSYAVKLGNPRLSPCPTPTSTPQGKGKRGEPTSLNKHLKAGGRSGAAGQLAEHLYSTHEALGSIPRTVQMAWWCVLPILM